MLGEPGVGSSHEEPWNPLRASRSMNLMPMNGATIAAEP